MVVVLVVVVVHVMVVVLVVDANGNVKLKLLHKFVRQQLNSKTTLFTVFTGQALEIRHPASNPSCTPNSFGLYLIDYKGFF